MSLSFLSCGRGARPRPTSQVLGCGEREITEKATPRYGAWGLFLTLGPHLGPRDPAAVTKQAGRGGACPPGAGKRGRGEASLCEYMAPAAGPEDASGQVRPLAGAQLTRRACRLGQEKPAQHKAVMSPPSFLLKSLPFRQKTWPPRWEQAPPPPGAAFGVQQRFRVSAYHPNLLGQAGPPTTPRIERIKLAHPKPAETFPGGISLCLFKKES